MSGVTDCLANDPARDDELILVDALDRHLGSATKWQAHTAGQLHRAFSVVLVRESGVGPEVLLARRAQSKYHSQGLWANSCCSHPRLGEKTIDAAYRRVREELGCEARDLREIASFVYRAEFPNGLVEHEFDHVLVGTFAGALDLDLSEVDATRWVSFDELARELTERPKVFSAWAPMVLTLAMKASLDEAAHE